MQLSQPPPPLRGQRTGTGGTVHPPRALRSDRYVTFPHILPVQPRAEHDVDLSDERDDVRGIRRCDTYVHVRVTATAVRK